MQLTRSDAFAVHRTGRLLRFLIRDEISEAEMINVLFNNFYSCETDLGIEQCVALIPKRLWPQIEEKVRDTLARSHPGKLFVYLPITPTLSELDKLDDRVRHTMAVVVNYLQNPTEVIEYEIDDPDGMRQQWFLFKHFETVAGERCRKPNCGEDRIHNGVNCRAHHFEMIFGQPPPTQQNSGN